MPSYIRPAPTRTSRRPYTPRKLPLDWVMRTQNALGALAKIPSVDPHTDHHVALARDHLVLLTNASRGPVYRKAHQAAARELAIAFHLAAEK